MPFTFLEAQFMMYICLERGEDVGICDWANVNEKMKLYHDCEWGFPVYDDTVQFEYLVLELMQSGLSWNTILQKRETLKAAYANFNYEVLADYGPEEADKIMTCEGIIRQRRKIKAVFQNARALKKIRREFGSFSDYLWSYTKGKVYVYKSHEKLGVPAANELSTAVAADLKKRGFVFLGPVTVYSHLQACGIIHDHASSCPAGEIIRRTAPLVYREDM